jgi:hypothetical protein
MVRSGDEPTARRGTRGYDRTYTMVMHARENSPHLLVGRPGSTRAIGTALDPDGKDLLTTDALSSFELPNRGGNAYRSAPRRGTGGRSVFFVGNRVR